MAEHHKRVIEEMRYDPNTCQVCGGWLGRRAGTKPFCTAWNCPGRSAPRKVQRTIFTGQEHDDLEEAKIKAAGRSNGAASFALSAVAYAFVPVLVIAMWAVVLRADSQSWLNMSGPPLVLGLIVLGHDGKLYALCALTAMLLSKLCLRSCSSLLLALVKQMLLYTLMMANIIALLALFIEPLLPAPGAQKSAEMCIDLKSFALRFDRSEVGAGPCFQLGMAFVQQISSESS